MWGRGQAARSAETRKVPQHRADERWCLCRAIFQYRSVADAARAGGGAAAKRGLATRASAISIKLSAGIGSSKAEHGPLLVPSQRQARVHQQLVCSQPARLAPLENGSRDVRGEYNIFRKVQRAGAVGLVLDQIRTTPRLGRVSPNFTLSPAISFLPHPPENQNFHAGASV